MRPTNLPGVLTMVLLFCFAPAPVSSQTAGAEALPTDSVDTRISDILSIDREEIEKLNPASLGELLEGRLAGVYSLDAGAMNPLHRTLRVRGPSSLAGCPALPTSRNWTSLACPGPVGHEVCSVCGPLVVVDGIPLAEEALANLHIDQVERVEVVAGPRASLVYGMDAAEGLILVTTRKGTPAAEYSVRASGSSIDSPYTESAPTSRSISATAAGASGDVGLFLGLGRQQFEGHVPSYDGRRNSASLGLRAGLGEFDTSAFVRWSEERYGDPGWGGVYYQLYTDGLLPSWGDRIIENNHSEMRRTTLGVNLRYRHSPRWSSLLTAGQDFFDFENRSVPSLSGSDSLTFIGTGRLSAPTVRIRTDLTQPIGNGAEIRISAGADRSAHSRFGFDSFHRLTHEPRIIFSQGDVLEERRVRTGGFLAARGAVSGWILGGGIRLDDEAAIPADSVGIVLSPQLELSYTGLDLGGWTLAPSLSWSRGAIAPAAFMLSGLNPAIASNPDLHPQRVTTAQGRIALLGEAGLPTLVATLFDQTTSDVFSLAAADTDLPMYVNSSGSINNRGLEATLSWEGSAIRTLLSTALFDNQVKSVEGEVNGDPVPYDPSVDWTLWAEAAVDLGGWLPSTGEIGGRIRAIGERWANDRRAVVESLYTEPSLDIHSEFPSTSEIDLFASATVLAGLTVRLDVLNLTDNVVPHVPEVVVAGREIRLSLKAAFGS